MASGEPTAPMPAWRSIISTAGLAAGLAVAASAVVAPPARADGAIELTLGGSPTLVVTGQCTVEAADGRQTVTIDAAPPIARRFVARAIACRLTAEGSGSAVLTLEGPRGNRSVMTLTPGGTAVVSVR
ncbi:MAG: hypothetical protein GVY27_06920 [Deinococcus-Thermus bacterium]|jgi:hypothetical protein|nr:hypothetical protein [Deinococcota bacterium]